MDPVLEPTKQKVLEQGVKTLTAYKIPKVI
jgi:hypothetical protein